MKYQFKSGEANPKWNGGVTKSLCIDCGKPVSKYHQRCKSCSRKGELSPRWNGGKASPVCIDCGVSIWRGSKTGRCSKCSYKFRFSNKLEDIKVKCIDCGIEINKNSKRCSACFHKFKIKNHQNIRGTKKYNDWRKIIISQRGNTCVKCGSSSTGRRLIVHHILPIDKYPDEIFNPDNVIILCRGCHKKIHFDIGIDTRFKNNAHSICPVKTGIKYESVRYVS